MYIRGNVHKEKVLVKQVHKEKGTKEKCALRKMYIKIEVRKEKCA